MPRTTGLVAICLSAIAAFAAAASQSPPAPLQPPLIVQLQQAPPPPPPPQVITAAAPGVAGNPNQSTGEIYQNATFSILDAAPVEAGQTLIFIVRREGHSGQAYQVNFEYSGGGLTIEPPPFMRFEPGDPSQKNLEVRTAAAQPGDGNNTVRVTLHTNDDGAVIGEPPSASGSIKVAPPSESVSYSLASDGLVSRGNDLNFTVTRTGPLGPAQVSYRIVQDGAYGTPDDAPDQVEFAEGQRDAPLVVPASRYSACGEDVTVLLDGGATASVRFSEPPPRYLCGPPPPPWWLEYLPLILGGLALSVATVLDKVLKPFVKVHPSCTITPGSLAFRPLEQPASRWPDMNAAVEMKPGELHVTQPLPRLEPPDG